MKLLSKVIVLGLTTLLSTAAFATDETLAVAEPNSASASPSATDKAEQKAPDMQAQPSHGKESNKKNHHMKKHKKEAAKQEETAPPADMMNKAN